MKVLYFGRAREAAGTQSETFTLPSSSSVGSLVSRSRGAHKGLESLHSSMRFAVNEEIAGEEAALRDGDVVAFLPPVAGG